MDWKLWGGAVNKTWPRKDIDVVIEMEDESGSSELIKAERSFEKLKKLVISVENASKGYFKKGNEHPPYTDPQLRDDNVLVHNGSIEITPTNGTKIEIVRAS